MYLETKYRRSSFRRHLAWVELGLLGKGRCPQCAAIIGHSFYTWSV
jgi:hypothetical protein